MDSLLNYQYREDFHFTQEHVILFSEASGDTNPIHLDDKYASNTIFKQKIIHGFLGGSIFSKILGTNFPGEGTIYLKQTLSFKRPMYINTTYTAIVDVLEIDENKSRAKISTNILDTNGNIVITGEALVQHTIFKKNKV